MQTLLYCGLILTSHGTGGGAAGVFLFFGLIIFLAVYLYKFSKKRNASNVASDAAIKESEWKLENREKQLALIERYATGELLPMALNYICKGDYTQFIPERIIVRDDCIQGVLNGELIEFNFAKSRIENLEHVCWVYSADDSFDDYVRPQVAMAEAINRLMKNEYEICDRGDLAMRERDFGDGDVHYWYIYTSRFVELNSKQMMPNRSF